MVKSFCLVLLCRGLVRKQKDLCLTHKLCEHAYQTNALEANERRNENVCRHGIADTRQTNLKKTLKRNANSEDSVESTISLLSDRYEIKLQISDYKSSPKEFLHELLWSLLYRFLISPCAFTLKEYSLFDHPELALLQWSRNVTFGYKKVDVTNFSSCWRSGLAFNALIHRYNPNWFNYSKLLEKSSKWNLEHAFSLAHERLSIPRILTPADVDVDEPDCRCVILYVTLLARCRPATLLPATNQPQSKNDVIVKVI
ncbi:hypothetical protein HELRODRAFT_164546 [Helobdella robusta]|uniref:Calponin-homology (CH) domain-containing protein n=1 Tax=Helobdella robusta TaxID=6412 RepID=T1EVK3_HELRO|nr:hypothetical protein HELRODRAFT_164546 [Helobdella robusta]ESN94665.1 hypothetical protein HELRODRAFT_164546 [Helobdella robusta]